ncbi:MAG: sulfotransferase family protein [Gammaproteobacteria bacterium]|jgi:hypothetical protein|nr:sulfotransferase family protein [Gammaproteobacteria bacterium]MBT4494938.1 sulfotransferase family protein [Gammaproteobacteria bacterium]
MRVIGAGLGRTGTNSLKIALEILLQGPCYHMFELWQNPEDVAIWQSAVNDEPVDWQKFLSRWVATVDWPGAPLFDQMAAAFPDALVLLSIRDGEEWYQSANNTIFSVMRNAPPGEKPPTGKLVASEFDKWLTLDIDNKAEVIAAHDRHNERVRKTIPPNRLLEWRPGDGWEPICSALDLPVPAEPFPHANDSASFMDTVKAAQNGDVERGFQPSD